MILFPLRKPSCWRCLPKCFLSPSTILLMLYSGAYVFVYFFFFMYVGDVCAWVYICMYWQVYMYSCACSLSSNPIDFYTVITCECSQEYGRTALLWASKYWCAETVRVLVELGASLEAVDKVNIHAHALAYTCCIKHVSGIMRMTIIIMSHAFACICVYMHSYIHVYSYLSYIYVFNYIYTYVYTYIHMRTHALTRKYTGESH